MGAISITREMMMFIEECCICGTAFGISNTMQKQLRKSHEAFYCPSGHEQHYLAKSDAELFRDEREARDTCQAENYRLERKNIALTRKLKRQEAKKKT